jgi:DNA primase
VKKDGIAAFCRLLESCQNIFDYKLNLLQDRYNAKEPEGKASIAAEMLPTIKRLKNEVLRDSYIRKLAQILEVDQGALILEMKKIKEYGHPSQFSRPASSSRSASASQTEKILLRLLLEEAQFALTLKESQSREFFSDGLLKDMVTLIGEWAHKGEEVSPGRLIRHFQDERVTQLVTEACSSEECYDPLIRQKIFSDCLQWFKEKARKMECARLQEEISRAQTKKDQARLKVLMGEYNALIKRGAGKHEKR